MSKFHCYAGQFLRVDLSARKISTEILDSELAVKYLGGRGFGAKMIWEELSPKTDPLSSENKLIFTTGPLGGLRVPTAARFAITTKSPLTNIFLYSIAGGHFGPALSHAGFDGIIIEGSADRPAYLYVKNGEAALKDATPIWGMTTGNTIRLIKESLGHDARVACIGPAGERAVRYSSVITDDQRACGRGGVGVVMGLKKLKAVVIRSEGKEKKYKAADPDKFGKALKRMIEILVKDESLRLFHLTGTQQGPLAMSSWGIHPTRNWNTCVFEGASKISYPSLRTAFVVRDTGCPFCPIACTKTTLVKEGTYAGAQTDGPEHESLYALGSSCGIDKPEAIIAADGLCNELGLDTMSTGLCISFAMECCETGILKSGDVDDLDLRFGNDEAMINMIKKIALRDGFGDLLAEGTKIAAQKIGKGSDRFAMHVKGLELGGYDPRGAKAQALAYAAGSRGGCHHSIGLPARVVVPQDMRFKVKGMGVLVRDLARRRIVFDSLMLCTFADGPITLDICADLLSAATGTEFTVDDLSKIGDRINSQERSFSLREGMTRADDTLPERILSEPLTTGPAAGQRVTPEELSEMLRDYFTALNWDAKTGEPLENR